MNELAKAFKANTLASVKANISDEAFVRELISLIGEEYSVNGLLADSDPISILEEIDLLTIERHLKRKGYRLENVLTYE